MRKILHVICCLILVAAGIWLVRDAVNNWLQQEKYQTLSEELQELADEKGTDRTEQLQVMTDDVVGYVEIPGTPVSYPVMQSEKEDGFYYMWRDVYGNRDGYGTPFLDIRCDMDKPSRNLIIYGHNMLNRTMFSTLKSYRKQEYRERHPEIILERGEIKEYYEVAAVLSLDVSKQADLDLFQFTDPETEEETEGYLEEITRRSLYDTGIKLSPDDYLVSLVSCYRYGVGRTGRTVVIGRRKS
jgi:sortase B